MTFEAYDAGGITMPKRTVGEYLRRWGLTVQRPAKRETDQKPEQVEAWLNEEYPAIQHKATAENAEIFWGDETAVQMPLWGAYLMITIM